jgi:hypothetical protein
MKKYFFYRTLKYIILSIFFIAIISISITKFVNEFQYYYMSRGLWGFKFSWILNYLIYLIISLIFLKNTLQSFEIKWKLILLITSILSLTSVLYFFIPMFLNDAYSLHVRLSSFFMYWFMLNPKPPLIDHIMWSIHFTFSNIQSIFLFLMFYSPIFTLITISIYNIKVKQKELI